MIEKVSHIRKRFPEKIDAVVLLMAEDPGFCEICEDYEVGAKALHYWAQSTKPEAKARVVEYRTIIQELEEEIVEALSLRKPGRSD